MTEEQYEIYVDVSRSMNEIKKNSSEVVEISREEFGLLPVEQDVTYYIVEEDGSITIKKGENK